MTKKASKPEWPRGRFRSEAELLTFLLPRIEEANRIMAAPGREAWIEFHLILRSAADNPTIAAHAPTRETVMLLRDLMATAWGSGNADEAMRPYIELLEKERQKRAALVSAEARKEAVHEWQDKIEKKALRMIRDPKQTDEGIGTKLAEEAGRSADRVAKYVRTLRRKLPQK